MSDTPAAELRPHAFPEGPGGDWIVVYRDPAGLHFLLEREDAPLVPVSRDGAGNWTDRDCDRGWTRDGFFRDLRAEKAAPAAAPSKSRRRGKAKGDKATRPPAPPRGGNGAGDGSDPRPLIRIRAGELARVCDEAQAALEAAPCGIYRQGSRLVRIGRARDAEPDATRGEREPDAPALYSVTTPALVDALARHARWEKWDGRREVDVPCDPPSKIAEIVLSREGSWCFPRLIGYTESPCVTPDGRLILAPGYDRPSGLMVLPHPLAGADILRSPLPDAAREAVEALREWLSTFPWATPEDEAAGLAAALTVVHRRTLRAAPLAAVSASTPATGKSRLVESFGVLATGRLPALFTAGTTPEELEKRLDVILLTGDQCAALDNVERPLKSDALCAFASQPNKSVRVLGASRSVDCPTNSTLMLTGNNLTLLGDLQRRTLLIRLDAGCERPEERVFSRDAIEYTRARRADLLRAALTIPLAYHAAGRPELGAKPYGSFEEWDRVIRLPLIWAGLPDPLGAAEAMRDEDHELVAMRGLLAAWWAIWADKPVTPSRVIEAARDSDHPLAPVPTGPTADLVEALRGLLGDGAAALNPKALGWKLRSWQGRILDGYRLIRAPRSSGGVGYQLDRV